MKVAATPSPTAPELQGAPTQRLDQEPSLPSGDATHAGDVNREIDAAIARGDKDEALRLLMSVHANEIYRFCHRMLNDPVLAEDVLQQVFLEAYRDLGRFSGRAFRAWLFSIARLRALDAVKRRKRENRHPAAHEAATELHSEQTPTSTEFMEDAQIGQALIECLSKLSPETREAVILRFQEGLSYDEMAQLCGEKPNTLQVRVSRALPVLRRCLERRLGDR